MAGILVVYDSIYGNTEKIAQSIGEAISGEVTALRAGEAEAGKLGGLDLFVAGCPTHGGRPSPAMKAFLRGIPKDGLRGVPFATFDTRVSIEGRNFAVRLLIRVLGFASPRMAKTLRGCGGRQVREPEGFVVLDREGPLKEGEVERAAAWATQLRPGEQG